jgi:hypothetical protein
MSYRDELEAQKRRCESLKRDLRALEEESAEAEALYRQLEAKRLPLLDQVAIASPCSESWDQMKGDEAVRFCGRCEKHVYNLSALSAEAAERLIREKEGQMCVRLYRRADGTVLTADCPVGVRRRRVKRAVVASVGGTLLAAGGLAAATAFARMGAMEPQLIGKLAQPSRAEPLMGAIAPAAKTEETVPPAKAHPSPTGRAQRLRGSERR